MSLVCVMLCVVLFLVSAGPVPRVDAAGKPACEKCGVRLSRVPHHRPYGVGRACAPQCRERKGSGNVINHTAAAAAASSGPPPSPPEKKKRHTHSDPGQSTPLTLTRLRTRAPKPPQTKRRKTKEERDAEIYALLDQTHANRMAYLAAAAAATNAPPPPPPPVPLNKSSLIFTNSPPSSSDTASD